MVYSTFKTNRILKISIHKYMHRLYFEYGLIILSLENFSEMH